MAAIIEAIYEMAWTYNHTAHLPALMPVALRYELILEWLNEPTFIPNVGTVNMDFCTGDARGYRLREWCGCLERWEENSKS